MKSAKRKGTPGPLVKVEPEASGQFAGWRMPSGRALAEFAISSGFIAPSLWRKSSARGETASSAATPAATKGEGRS